MSKIEFDFSDMPQAFLCDNKKTSEVRKQMIKNLTPSSVCNTPELSEIFFLMKIWI